MCKLRKGGGVRGTGCERAEWEGVLKMIEDCMYGGGRGGRRKIGGGRGNVRGGRKREGKGFNIVTLWLQRREGKGGG